MPTRRDADDERFARIEALMEEYRINHEELEAYVRATTETIQRRHRASREGIRTARATFKQSKKPAP